MEQLSISDLRVIILTAEENANFSVKLMGKNINLGNKKEAESFKKEYDHWKGIKDKYKKILNDRINAI